MNIILNLKAFKSKQLKYFRNELDVCKKNFSNFRIHIYTYICDILIFLFLVYTPT